MMIWIGVLSTTDKNKKIKKSISNTHTEESELSPTSQWFIDAATPSHCRVSEVNLCVNKWWVQSENLVTVGIQGVRVKSSADIQEKKHIQLCNPSRKGLSYFISSSVWLRMWAKNQLDGFIAVNATHNGSPLLRSERQVSERRAGCICLIRASLHPSLACLLLLLLMQFHPKCIFALDVEK